MSKQKLDFKSKSMILSILTGIGVVTTAVLSAYCAKKDDDTRPIKQRAMIYAPAIASGVVTVSLVAVNAKVSSAEVAALTAACAGLTQRYRDYKDAAQAVLSDEDYDKVEQEFASERAAIYASEHPDMNSRKQIFVDRYTGYTFQATVEAVEAAERKIESMYEEDEPCCWCDLFYLATETTIPYQSVMGNQWGWSKAMIEDIYGDYYGSQEEVSVAPLKFENVLTEEDGFSFYRIEYNYDPEPNFGEY